MVVVPILVIIVGINTNIDIMIIGVFSIELVKEARSVAAEVVVLVAEGDDDE